MAHFQDEEAYRLLEPQVQIAVTGLTPNRFSTKAVIEAVLSIPEGTEAYGAALALLKDQGATDHTARLVVHGQVVPGLLRRCGLVRFAGFVHGDPAQDDGYAVPSWWQRL